MDQDRKRNRDEDRPNRSSNMEQAEGSRESQMGTESMRNQQKKDLGTSSDRAMFEDQDSAEQRKRGGVPASGDRKEESTREQDGNAGGITNRPLDREQKEQEQLPPRGRSQTDSER
jgi:hypothetical protein